MSAPRPVADPEPPWPAEEWVGRSLPGDQAQRRRRKLVPVPLAEFLAQAASEPAPTWLVEGLVPDRGRVLIQAEPHAGKTWMALVASVAGGKAGRKVIFIEEEGTKRGFALRLKGLKADGGIHLLFGQGVLVDNAEDRAGLAELARSDAAPIFVVDPLVSAHQQDENDTQGMSSVTAHLSEVLRANPATLLLVAHHTGKNSDVSDIYRGRGSSTLGGWADVILNLEHVPSRRGDGKVAFKVLVAKCREGERGLRRQLRIDLETGDIESLDVDEASSADQDAAILKQLRKAPFGLKRNVLLAELGGRKGSFLKRVRALLKDGTLVEKKNPEGGAKLIALAPSAADDLDLAAEGPA